MLIRTKLILAYYITTPIIAWHDIWLWVIALLSFYTIALALWCLFFCLITRSFENRASRCSVNSVCWTRYHQYSWCVHIISCPVCNGACPFNKAIYCSEIILYNNIVAILFHSFIINSQLSTKPTLGDYLYHDYHKRVSVSHLNANKIWKNLRNILLSLPALCLDVVTGFSMNVTSGT